MLFCRRSSDSEVNFAASEIKLATCLAFVMSTVNKVRQKQSSVDIV